MVLSYVSRDLIMSTTKLLCTKTIDLCQGGVLECLILNLQKKECL